MVEGYNLGQAGTLSADEFSQQQQLNRQQQMAALLMQQGQKPAQGQMVGNRFVPSSFFQNITPLVQTALGSYMGNKADTEAAKLAQTIRQNKGDVEQQIINKMTPQPAIPQEMAGPYGVSGAGQNVPMPVGVLPAKEADYASALKMIQMNPYGAGKEYVPTILKQLTPELTPEEKRFKAAVSDGSWNVQKQGGLNSFLNQMNDKDRASLILDKQRLGLENARLGIAQQELAFNTGMGMGNGGGMVAGGAQGPNKQFAPATAQQYEFNPALTGKQNQEQAGKFYENLQKNVTNAKDSFDLMKEASKVLSSDVASSGRLSSIGTGIGEFFGADSKASQADAQLNMLSGALTMKQPRFEGPQGVLDVTLYQKLAGDLGNPNIPIPSRLATMQQMVNLQKKYYPNGDWDSISTSLKDSGKVSMSAPQYATNPQTGERRMSTDGGKTWNPAR
jgi:hypothetical protein